MKMANPRKFIEKIALHEQKQAEETAAFEQIMREVGVAVPKVNIAYRVITRSDFHQTKLSSSLDFEKSPHLGQFSGFPAFINFS